MLYLKALVPKVRLYVVHASCMHDVAQVRKHLRYVALGSMARLGRCAPYSLDASRAISSNSAAGDAFRVRVLPNPAAAPPHEAYEAQHVISERAHARAHARVRAWPEFAPTVTVSLPEVALACGVASVHAKLEGSRCGLGSFKALGGGLAVDVLADQHGGWDAGLTVTTASAGNHGLAVAWGAQRRNVRCVIFVHENVGDAVCARMDGFGAEVRRVPGDYNDSVEACKTTAAAEGSAWHMLQDVSWDGYTEVPTTIWQGYSTVASEMVEDLGGEELPTHVLVNAGVGGFAASVCGWFWDTHGAARPRFVCVEPDEAACLMESGKHGCASEAVGGGDTIQTGLNCAAAAPLAWEVLERGVNDFVSIGDECVGPCLRLLAETHVGEHSGIIGGASGVAGLGVLLAAAEDPALAKQLQLDAHSRVALVVCEGAVEPELFEKLVGTSAETLRRGGALE